ncbi:MAG: hypothetical protein QOE59_1145 [Actinomycetota bacterium]|nr:hypothetical protein [Actinomycetota bacterium]
MVSAGRRAPRGGTLQLTALAAAVDRFVAEVWQPAATLPAGLPRLRGLCGTWLSYLERDVFPGGCFLTSAAAELDDRPGPLRDAVAAAASRWLAALAREAGSARDAGDLPADTEPEQVAFELNATFMAANQAHRLGTDPRWTERARTAVDRVLGSGRGRAGSLMRFIDPVDGRGGPPGRARGPARRG